MKLETVKSNVEVKGDISRNAVGIDTSDLNFILTIISTKLYSKPIESFVREITSNAWDSHVEAGTTDPVVISINNSITNSDNLKVSIQDFGVGLSPERFEKVFKKAGSSTKRDSNDQIGGFGIGRFSALSVSDMVHILSNYNGTQYTYLMYKDGSDINIDLALESPTTEPNGLIFSLDIPKKDWSVLKGGIINQLRYFDNVFVQGDYDRGFNQTFNDIQIQTYNTFLISSKFPDNDKNTLLLGKVAYPIDRNELLKYVENDYEKDVVNNITGIDKRISVKFNIGELQVTPNREQLLYDSHTARVIIEKYSLFFQELINMKSEKFKDGLTFMELYKTDRSDYYDIPFLEGKINTSGLEYRLPVTINGMVHTDFKVIQNLTQELLGEHIFEPYYHVDRYKYMTRHKYTINMYSFLKDSVSIPVKLKLIERKFLKENYKLHYLGHWDSIDISRKLVIKYRRYLRTVDKTVLKSFLHECITYWNTKETYSINNISQEFIEANRPKKRAGTTERYYGVQRIPYNGWLFKDKYTYSKANLARMTGNRLPDLGVQKTIVVADTLGQWKVNYPSAILQLISRHVTIITGPQTTVKYLKTLYPTLDSWVDANNTLLKQELYHYKRFLEYKNSAIDLDNVLSVEKTLSIKVGLNFNEKKFLDKKFNFQITIDQTDLNFFGELKCTKDLKKKFEQPNLLKIAELIDSFPLDATPKIREVYSKSLLNYLKQEKLVDNNNKIVYI